MTFDLSHVKLWIARVRQALAVLLVVPLLTGVPIAAFPANNAGDPPATTTPIKHVIVIIGENRTFDSIFGTYVPKSGLKTIDNLLSRGIVTNNGTAGPNFGRSRQFMTTETPPATYQISFPAVAKTAYAKLPPPNTSYAPQAPSDVCCANTPPPAPFQTAAVAADFESDLISSYNKFLLTGATGLANGVFDTRTSNALNLPNGVFQLTGPALPYDAYAGDMVHRFYQMWQQFDCNKANISAQWPNGCLADLLPWVEVTTGSSSPTGARLTCLKTQVPPAVYACTQEGSNAMSFFNVQQGDAPYLKFLADRYTMSDNYHQPVMGGTMVQHLMLGYADLLWYSDGNGNPLPPPAGQVENPNPQAGTNNAYTTDGGGAVYSQCADAAQPGVAPIRSFLASLPRPINPNCDAGHWYTLNNQSPQFNEDGTLSGNAKTVPPTTVRHIGDALSAKKVSWVYYGGHWDLAVAGDQNAYCNICNPFQYAKDIMSSKVMRTTHIKDTFNLHQDIQKGTLPAVSYVKPDGLVDGHPASSKLDLFEGFVKKIVTEVQANKELWKTTAIFVTFDEGGGWYDQGYFQALDYFGDGPRIPLIVVSPFTRGGKISHLYGDHASIVKFIEHNWNLGKLSGRSRDNLPNPITAPGNPYVPTNGPAVSDLLGMFDFGNPRFDDGDKQGEQGEQ